MDEHPSNTLTFFLTRTIVDPELRQQNPHAFQQAVNIHDSLVRRIIKENKGYLYKIVGDSLYSVFHTADNAIEAAYKSQLALLGQDWGEQIKEFKVSMALHSGEVRETSGDYSGPALDHAIALLDSAHGSQVLLSQPSLDLVKNWLPGDLSLAELGRYRLKDLGQPELIFQLVTSELPSEFPAIRTLDNWPHNLPILTTDFFGREQEIERACRLLRQGKVRLMTFTGAGGSGKTRLSLQIAATMLHEFEDGVYFVELAASRQAEEVVTAISRILDMRESSGREQLENLKSYLRNHRLLLVLDNLEQVAEVARLVSELLEAAPGLKILISSRISLQIYGEQDFPVHPLSLPSLTKLPPLSELYKYSAIKLFINRAKRAHLDFELDSSNATEIVEICTRLDGLPLALELAAALCKTFSFSEMLAQLSQRLDLLLSEDAAVPMRQRTLRGAIDWSYNLLEESEQTLFARLGIFVGGGTIEAIEAICNPDNDPELDIFELLSNLVNKSLLVQTETSDGLARFSMLETIREYALERLEQRAELTLILQQFRDYFVTLAEEAEQKLTGVTQLSWFHLLGYEYLNLRVVVEHALEPGVLDIETVLRLGGALWRFWSSRGYLLESRGWLMKALPNSEAVDGLIRAKAWFALAIINRDLGEFEVALQYLEKSLELYRALNDRQGLALVLNTLGTVMASQGKYLQAIAYIQETITMRRDLQDKRGLAASLCILGAVYAAQDNFDAAMKYYQEALGLLRQLGDRRTLGQLLNNMGFLWIHRGDNNKASDLIEEALTTLRELDDKSGIAASLNQLGDLAIARGDYFQARKYYIESLHHYYEIGDNLNIIFNLEGLARLYGLLNKPALSVILYGRAGALRKTINVPRQLVETRNYEELMNKARSGLEAADFKAAWERGETLPLKEVISLEFVTV